MKKTDWTDRMLAALVELYPVETTAYTAAVLNLSESTVKLKARELGLVKMAKSRWMERADYIRNHFQECSFSESSRHYPDECRTHSRCNRTEAQQ